MNNYDNPITDYCFAHYFENGLCTLCGQSGIIKTDGIASPAGVDVGRENYCICPNGQALRKRAEDARAGELLLTFDNEGGGMDVAQLKKRLRRVKGYLTVRPFSNGQYQFFVTPLERE